MRVAEKVDQLFAKAYVQYMTQARQAFYVQKATRELNKIEIAHVGDVEYLRETADKYSKAAPTLKNLNAFFAGSVASSPNVVKAQEISGRLETELEMRMGEIVDRKLADFRQRQLDEQAFDGYFNVRQSGGLEFNEHEGEWFEGHKRSWYYF